MPYGVATLGGQGVELTYTDPTGVAWRTTCAGQSASTFTIVDVENGSDGLGPYVIVKADFTATFANCSTGATKTASDGVLVFALPRVLLGPRILAFRRSTGTCSRRS
jgi:hypothetical protein